MKRRIRAQIDDDSADAVANGRERRSGRFAPGNQAAVGRARPRSDMREAFEAAVTPEDLAEIARALVRRAKRGDVRAAQALLDRILGRVPIKGALQLLDDFDDNPDLIDWTML